jgi:hypothetical protein
VGAVLSRSGLALPSLDDESMFRRARRDTGLDDFGDDWFRTPLRRLLDAMENESALTTLGRITARADIVRLLGNRLRIEDAHRQHPEIGASPISAPIFVVGLPRTGTSILHELLAQDPANRTPMSWEVMHPWPPPERATCDTDPRIALVDKHLGGVDRLIPGFKTMHPMGARLPQECVALMQYDFASMVWSTTHRVPSYQAWLGEADVRPLYRSHRRQLQYLQWRWPADRWVLKSPGHLWMLDALLAVYPDARIVQTHRDPLTVVASLTSLVGLLRRLASDDVDMHEIGAYWTALLADGLERSMAARDRADLPSSQIVDMHFRDFIADEVGFVRRIYEHFGLELSAEAEARMRRFLVDNARDKHGRHRYTLRDAGLDVATERRRFARYQERFGIPSEEIGQ